MPKHSYWNLESSETETWIPSYSQPPMKMQSHFQPYNCCSHLSCCLSSPSSSMQLILHQSNLLPPPSDDRSSLSPASSRTRSWDHKALQGSDHNERGRMMGSSHWSDQWFLETQTWIVDCRLVCFLDWWLKAGIQQNLRRLLGLRLNQCSLSPFSLGFEVLVYVCWDQSLVLEASFSVMNSRNSWFHYLFFLAIVMQSEPTCKFWDKL